MATSPIVLRSQAGIKRDGTKFDGEFYTDGQWVRFQRGLPRKIWGYRSIARYFSEVCRGLAAFTQQSYLYCHYGAVSSLQRFTLDSAGNASVLTNRTPAGYTAGADNMWMFDYMYDSSTTANSIIAHVAPNSSCICSAGTGYIYTGDVLGTTALTAVTLPAGANASGGVVVLHPYLFYYGTAGIIGWSVAGNPNDLTGAGSGIARVWGQKIIKGMPLRAGAGSAPAGLFWAYDAVIRSSFVGGSAVFQFDIIATDTSILSTNSVIDFDGVYYWAAVDRFMMFSGVVREVPNQLNLNWFFDNINTAQRQKVFAFKVPRFGEIWWCYPRGSATECTHAVIFNVRENTWYDTQLPGVGRTAGVYSNAYAAPLLTDVNAYAGGYKTWIHEQGRDEVDGITTNPIPSWFETSDFSTLTKGENAEMRIARIEPDFVQAGDMTVTVTGRINARAPEVSGTSFTFNASATSPQEQTVMLKEQRREMRVKFYSNAVGGDYQMGQIIAHVGTGDKTVIG